MRVKRLEISGFKSFAERTVIDFPEGLCAVVGPNGCGKSNLVDAVRWVLGEQSAKQLRGHTMEDLIFNGSHQRNPSGLSEVSMVFDNNGSITAPQFTDLSEIMVTRRLYRSGESEYQINRVPCRLKDIHQLFMDTGLGNRDYAIVEQGRVAAFIESKPEERRLWVEEAAGITRYKNQKKVSLRKMQSAKDNLERLSDIILEVETQMQRLKRQAKKAQRHRELRQRIRELDLNVSAVEYQRLCGDLEEAGAEAEAVGARLLLSQQRVTGLETDLETLRMQLVAAEQEISQSGASRLEAQGAIQKAENELTLLGREIESTSRLVERFGQERQELQGRVQEQEREHARAQRLVRQSETRQQESAQALEQASGEVSERQEELAGLEDQLDQAKDQVISHLGSISQANNRLADLERSQQELNRRSQKLSQLEQSLSEEMAEIDQALGQAQDQVDQLRAAMEETGRQDQELNQARDQAGQRINNLSRAEQSATRASHELAASVDALALSLSSHEWAQSGVRQVLKSAAQDQAPVEVLGLVAEHLSVAPGSEALVEAALGPELQALLVRDGNQARQLAAWIEEQGLGRLRILALEELTPAHAQPPQGSSALAEAARAEKGFEALEVLLSGVGWCEQAQEAWNAAGRMSPGQVVISRSGQRLDRAGGAMVGRAEGGSVLAKRNELAQRRQQLERSQQALADVRQELEQAQGQLSGLEEQHRQLTRRLQEQEQELGQAQQRALKQQEVRQLKERQLEGLHFETEEIAGELHRLRGERHALEQELEQLEQDRQEVEQALAQTKELVAQGRLDLDEAREQEAAARLEAASLASEVERAQQDVQRLGRELAASRERIEALAAEIKGAQDTVESLQGRREEGQVRLAGLYEDLDRKEEEHRRAREVHTQAQVKVSDLEASLKQAREALRQVEGESQDINWRQRELGMQREQLTEQVMERCRVDLSSEHEGYLPAGGFDSEASREKLAKLRTRLARLGPVNMEAISEHEALAERHEFLTNQRQDLDASLDDLRQAIRKINRTTRGRFLETLEEVNLRLSGVFPVLFGGGSATLVLEEGVDPLDAGLHIMVELPGKKIRNLEALSGGEKAFTAVAVLFALFLIKPAPFCLLDEVDAPLDEANIGRFHDLLKQINQRSQVMMVTHNRRTMEVVEVLYGVTMEEKGISKLLAVSLAEGEAMAA